MEKKIMAAATVVATAAAVMFALGGCAESSVGENVASLDVGASDSVGVVMANDETEETTENVTEEVTESVTEARAESETENTAQEEDETVIIAGQEFSVNDDVVRITITHDMNPITDISALGKLKKLKSLFIQADPSVWGEYRIDGLKELTGCESLEKVFFELDTVNADDWHVLETLPNLREIDINSCIYENLDIELPLLESLYLTITDPSGMVTDIGKCEKFANLHYLEIEHISNEETNPDADRAGELDISAISKLTKLRHFTFIGSDGENYKLTGTQSISRLTNLELLQLLNCNVEDFSFLESLENMEFIDFDNCTVNNEADWDLHKLDKLDRVYVYDCGITDVGFLSDLENVTDMQLACNNIVDLSGLKNLPNLKRISLRENQISDVSPLADLPALSSIGLSNNNISDVSGLAKSESIYGLDLDGNQITDISQFSKLKHLSGLDISYNPVTDISDISKCTNLWDLKISGNNIIDYAPIGELTDMEILTLENSNCTDFSFIEKLTKLWNLDISDNNISDISFLKELPLSFLILNNNNISDISPIYGIRERARLSMLVVSLYGNPIDEQDVNDFKEHVTRRESERCVWFDKPYSPYDCD